MLKPLTQPRSPASPSFHYAPVSQPLPTSPLSRRNSGRAQSQINRQSPVQKPAPPPPVLQVRYADVGTQWESPVMNTKQDPDDGQPIVVKIEPKVGAISEVPVSIPAVPRKLEKPLLEPLSPSSKRRQSSANSTSAGVESHAIAPKRVRPAQTEVKILSKKYELCEVEDMVILIANMISELIVTNDELPLRNGVLTRFHSR